MVEEKVLEGLNKIEIELKELLNNPALNGDKHFEEFRRIKVKLITYIRRIYPNPLEIEKNYFPRHIFMAGMDLTKALRDDIKDGLNAIESMKEEFEVFGDDFTPIKKKTETKFGIGKIFERKTTKEKG